MGLGWEGGLFGDTHQWDWKVRGVKDFSRETGSVGFGFLSNWANGRIHINTHTLMLKTIIKKPQYFTHLQNFEHFMPFKIKILHKGACILIKNALY